jgi:RNA polymerase sigma factor (sigma-70 family)
MVNFHFNIKNNDIYNQTKILGIMDSRREINLSPEYILRNYSDVIKKSIKILASKYLKNYDPFLLEDIEQEVNLRIINGCLNTYRGEASLKYYISAFVVRSTFLNIINKVEKTDKKSISSSESFFDILTSKAENTQLNRSGMDHSSGITDRIAIENIISEELQKMSPRRQDIYRMHIDEGKTQIEISEELNISQSTISEHWSKITQQLRSALLKQLPELKTAIGNNYEKSRLN